MITYFATPERISGHDLQVEIDLISSNPLVSGLLFSVGGLLAVLNKHRQIVALNGSFLKTIGIDDPAETLGLRPGEALSCVHSCEQEGGCGTSRFCSTCGAAIAIVASMEEDRVAEKICALTANRNGALVDLALHVRSHPIRIDGERFLLLFMQDISREQQRAALERTFFHDINNVLSSLAGASELLLKKDDSRLARMIHSASARLVNEVAIQQYLVSNHVFEYQPRGARITLSEICEELENFLVNHPAAKEKRAVFPELLPDTEIFTDRALLTRVLCNMIINALEATPPGGGVKVWCEHPPEGISFFVWNGQEIPEEIRGRIFQRNFSTKDGAGRGVGTFSMKLLGEKLLGGRVSFSSSREEGTTFCLFLAHKGAESF